MQSNSCKAIQYNTENKQESGLNIPTLNSEFDSNIPIIQVLERESITYHISNYNNISGIFKTMCKLSQNLPILLLAQ